METQANTRPDRRNFVLGIVLEMLARRFTVPLMAVIVVGKRQPKSERRACAHCGVLLEYLKADVREEQGFRYVDCPQCKHSNYLGTDSSG